MVGTKDRKNAWVLSRTPSIDDATVTKILARYAEVGFDSTKFIHAVRSTEFANWNYINNKWKIKYLKKIIHVLLYYI